MKPLKIGIFATAMAAAGMIAATGGASAQAMRAPAGLTNPDAAMTETVQYRRSYSYGDRRYYRGGRYDDRRYGGRYYRDRGVSPGVALGAGLAAGALAAGAIAAQQDRSATVVIDDDAANYCAQRFRSYDPASGTYVGYDGQRRACP